MPTSPHEAIFYLRGRGVDAIRVGDWKYRIATDKPPKEKKSKRRAPSDKRSKKIIVETLHDLSDDLGEQNNLLAEHPEVVVRLKKQMEDFEKKLRANIRPAGVANQP